jgi:hypothetical protein
VPNQLFACSAGIGFVVDRGWIWQRRLNGKLYETTKESPRWYSRWGVSLVIRAKLLAPYVRYSGGMPKPFFIVTAKRPNKAIDVAARHLVYKLFAATTGRRERGIS